VDEGHYHDGTLVAGLFISPISNNGLTSPNYNNCYNSPNYINGSTSPNNNNGSPSPIYNNGSGTIFRLDIYEVLFRSHAHFRTQQDKSVIKYSYY